MVVSLSLFSDSTTGRCLVVSALVNNNSECGSNIHAVLFALLLFVCVRDLPPVDVPCVFCCLFVLECCHRSIGSVFINISFGWCFQHLPRFVCVVFVCLISIFTTGRSTTCFQVVFCFCLFSSSTTGRLDLFVIYRFSECVSNIYPVLSVVFVCLFVCFRFLPPVFFCLFHNLTVPCCVVSCRAVVAGLQLFDRFCSVMLCKQTVSNVILNRCGSIIVKIIELF